MTCCQYSLGYNNLLGNSKTIIRYYQWGDHCKKNTFMTSILLQIEGMTSGLLNILSSSFLRIERAAIIFGPVNLTVYVKLEFIIYYNYNIIKQ